MSAPSVIDPLVSPEGLSAAAERLWRHGDNTDETDSTPVAGDIWIATTDTGHDVSLVLVQRVFDAPSERTGSLGYVSAGAVTTTDTPASGWSLLIQDTPLGIPLVWHPEIGTGMDFRALTRRIGNVTDHPTIVKGRRWVEGDLADPPLPVHRAGQPIDDEAASDSLADLCARAWVLGDSYSEFSSLAQVQN